MQRSDSGDSPAKVPRQRSVSQSISMVPGGAMRARAHSSGAASAKAPREKTICAVCQVESDNHHIHYGALACFSCRAFFRRAHNKGAASASDGSGSNTDDPGYVCKQDGKCDVTAKNRKKCQKCRYDRCLSMGMNPALVLTDEQKRVRFRKMLEKKTTPCSTSASGFSRKRSNTNPSSTDEEDDSNDGDDDLESPDHKFSRDHVKNPFDVAGVMSMSCPSSSAFLTNFGSVDSGVGLYAADRARIKNESHMMGVGGMARPAIAVSFPDLIDESQIKQEILAEFGLASDSNTPQLSPLNPLDVRGLAQPSTSSYVGLGPQQPQPTYHNAAGVSPPPAYRPRVSDEDLFHILRSYDYALRTVNLDADTSGRLITFHCGMGSGSEASAAMLLSRADVRRMLVCVGERFRAFAMQLHTFSSLCLPDQRQLLAVNTPAYVQYIFGRYLSAADGVQQLRVLMGHETPDILSSVPLDRVAPDVLLTSTDLFRLESAQDMLSYSDLSAELGQQSALGDAHEAMVAALILFRHSHPSLQTGTLYDPQRVADVAGSVVTTAAEVSGFSRGLIAHILNVLDAMSRIFSRSIDLNAEDNVVLGVTVAPPTSTTASVSSTSHVAPSPNTELAEMLLLNSPLPLPSLAPSPLVVTAPPSVQPSPSVVDSVSVLPAAPGPYRSMSVDDDEGGLDDDDLRAVVAPKHLEMPYTSEEEGWLTQQLDRFRGAYDQVSLGEELVNEFIMFSYDVPLSKHYVPSEISAFAERCRRILKTHNEFNSLNDSTQAEVIRENCHKAVALCSVKAETFRKGTDQLKFCFGNDDHKNWGQKFSPFINTKLKKVLITDWNRTSNAMDSETLLSYLQHTGNISNAVEDLETFQIMALLVLFSGNKDKLMAQMGKTYNTILQRRVRANGQKGTSSKVRSGLESVDELATIFQRLETF